MGYLSRKLYHSILNSFTSLRRRRPPKPSYETDGFVSSKKYHSTNMEARMRGKKTVTESKENTNMIRDETFVVKDQVTNKSDAL